MAGFFGSIGHDTNSATISNAACYTQFNYYFARVDSGYRSAMSVQSSLVMHPISKST